MAHRHQLELERKDIREQITDYYQATFQLNDEISGYEKVLISSYDRLANLDPPRRSLYEEAERSAEVVTSHLAQMKPMTEKNLPGILAAKDMQYLKNSLELSKKFYNLSLEVSKKQYVYSQLISGYVGHLEQGQETPPSPEPSQITLSSLSENELTKLKSNADGGSPEAQALLGNLYRDGNGVAQNFVTAAKWLRLAATQGNAQSQLALGILCEEGHGVVQDYIQAHMWYNLAAAAGIPGAEARRNAVSARMTMEQLSEAQKLAAQWRPDLSHK